MTKEIKNNFEKVKSLLGHPIAYYPSLAKLTGSVNGGLLLSQALYWQNKKGEDLEFYKTRNEWEKETCLSHAKQKSAEDAIQKTFAITISKKGIPAKNNYIVHFQKLIYLFSTDTPSSSEKKDEQDRDNNPGSDDRKVEPITETSPKTSAETSHNTQECDDLPDEVVKAYKAVEKTTAIRNPAGLMHDLLKKYKNGTLTPPQIIKNGNSEMAGDSIDTEELRLAASDLAYFKDMIEFSKTEEVKEAFREQLSMAEEQFTALKKSIAVSDKK